MTRLTRHFLFALILIQLLLPAMSISAPMKMVQGQVLVCLEDGADGASVLAGGPQDELTGLLEKFALDQRQFVANPLNKSTGPESRFLLLASSLDNFDPLQAARALAATPQVRSASPNYYRPLLVVPNDPMISTQWYLQPGSSAAVGLDQAWEIETGSPATVIAIIDTGVDTSHPDLAANIWTNVQEIPGNGLDDDANGYVDDTHGWDFGNNDNDPRPHPTPDASGVDVGFHGTHCAGIAAAVTDNNTGVAGAGWNCSIMPLKLPNSAGEMTDVAITGAILYAVAEGADVISMSFGGPDQDNMAAFMQDLMDQALNANVVCVAAAGNSNTNEMFYPAACEGVISVGATDENNQRASFSTYGPWVDIAAPGNRIWSTLCQNYEFGFLDGLLYMVSMGWDGSNPYMYSDGTSMACPLVAGVCGLLRNQSPGLTPEALLQRLIDSGDEVAFDQPIGVKLNVAEAVASVSAAPAVSGPARTSLAACPNPFNPSTRLDFSLQADGPVEIKIYDSAGHLVRGLLSEVKTAGNHSVFFDGSDNQGRALASGVYFARVTSSSAAVSEKLLLVK